MFTHSRWLKALSLVVLVAASTACNEEKEINARLEAGKVLQKAVLTQAAVEPYGKEQHEAFATYFGQVLELKAALESDSKIREAFGKALAKQDLGAICQQGFISQAEWAGLVRRCTKGRYFLCAESMRNYGPAVKAIHGYLPEAQKRRFDESAACRAILPETDS